MKKVLTAILILALAAAAFGCAGQGGVATPPPASSTPAQTSAAPDATQSAEPSPSASPAATDEAAQGVSAAEYMPRANLRAEMDWYNGQDVPTKTAYVYAAFSDNAEEGYALSRFLQEQPIYYTDYYIDDTAWTAQFSDAEGEGRYTVMPALLSQGLEFEGRGGDKSIVAEIGAAVDIGGYTAQDCLIIKTASTTYMADVYSVYQKGCGEVAQYILYDDDVIDIIMVAQSLEEITQEQADAIMAES